MQKGIIRKIIHQCPDAEYDKLYRELVALEAEHPKRLDFKQIVQLTSCGRLVA